MAENMMKKISGKGAEPNPASLCSVLLPYFTLQVPDF